MQDQSLLLQRMPIRILPPSLVHRIAAGEVIDRPCQAPGNGSTFSLVV